MTSYWKPDPSADKNPDLAELMNLAAAALEAEDVHLAGLVHAARGDKTRASHLHASTNVGRGLSYWLYETTLVYVVWRAWMAAGKAVALDWSAAQLSPYVRQPPKVRGKSYDLVIFANERSPGFVFEAKRWNYTAEAMLVAVSKDAEKLRNVPADLPHLSSPQKYILLFEHSPSTLDESLATLCRAANLRVAGTGAFPAWFWRGHEEVRGEFVIHALEVRVPGSARAATP